MSSGLRALMSAAQSEPLDFYISIYSGEMIISGRVAPSSWWYEITKNGYAQMMELSYKKIRDRSERERAITDDGTYFRELLDWTESQERTGDVDELTLIDVSILPAVASSAGKPGGHRLPVARVPLVSVSTWWVVDGEEIKGVAGFSGGFGFLFPIGDLRTRCPWRCLPQR